MHLTLSMPVAADSSPKVNTSPKRVRKTCSLHLKSVILHK
jgi:hypothetical protein